MDEIIQLMLLKCINISQIPDQEDDEPQITDLKDDEPQIPDLEDDLPTITDPEVVVEKITSKITSDCVVVVFCMDLFAFIHTLNTTKVKVVERDELGTSIYKLFDEGGSGSQVGQRGSAGVGEGTNRKKKTVVADAGGSSHPPKNLREDHGTLSGPSVAGKSSSAVQILLAGAVLNAHVRGETIPTLPFVTSSVSAMLEREGGDHTDFVTGLNLRTISASQRFVISSDSSHHSGDNVAEAEVDSLARSSILVMTVVTTTTSTADSAVVVKEKTAKPYLFVVDSSFAGGADPNAGMSLSAEVKMCAEYNIKEKRRLKSAVEEKDELLKSKDKEIENLKAQIDLKEAEAAEAIRLRAEALNFVTMKKSLRDEVNIVSKHNTILKKERNALDVKVADLEASAVHELEVASFGLQKKLSNYKNLTERLEKFQDAQLKVVNDKFDKLYVDFVEIALHLEERFYSHLLTTIFDRRWLLTHGIELAIAKCLHSPEYLSALGVAIGKAIEKGMQDGLSAGITHGAEGRVLTDIASYNPSAEADYISALQHLQNVNFPLLAELRSNKDSSVDTLMNILRLEETLAERLGFIESQPHVNQLMVPIHHSPDQVVVGASALSLALDVSSSQVRMIEENIANHRSALRDVFVPLADHLSATSLTGMEGTSNVISATADTTTALSTTLASASTVAHISVDDYEVAGTDDRAGVDGNADPFPDVDDAELNIPLLLIFQVSESCFPSWSLNLYAPFLSAFVTLYGPSHLVPTFPVSSTRLASLLRSTYCCFLPPVFQEIEVDFQSFIVLYQCQPIDQNIDFSGSDQIQTPQYPEIHPPSNEISDEVFQAKCDLMKSIQSFLEEFNYIPFGEKPKILLEAWDNFFRIQRPPQDFDIRQLIRKECCIEVCEEQKQSMEDTILELVKICRQKELLCMHDNVDDLIESALNSKLLSINSQRLDKEKQEVKNVVEQPAERRTLAPILSNKEPEYSPSMRYEHPNTTPEMESDEIMKSGVEELVPILSENEVTLEDKRECDMPVCEDSSASNVCDDHSEIFSDSKDDDDISSDDDDFEDVEYVEASLSNTEIVSVEEENGVEEENVVHQEEEEIDFEDISQIQDVVLCDKLLSINRLIANIKSLNDNPTPDRMLNSSVSVPISKESDNSLSDNSSPEFQTFCDHTEETRSGNTTTHADDSLPEYDSFCFEIEPDHERLINVLKNDISDNSTSDPLLEETDLFLSDNSIPPGIENFANDSEGDISFLEALLIDDSILSYESSDSNFEDNPSVPQPPPKPPDAEPDSEEEIPVVINDKDVCNDDDYYYFMFVICFSFLLSAESEDTIFDPGFTPHRLKFLVSGYLSRPKDLHILSLRLVWGNLYPLISIA
nr:putative transposase (putative), gypsy type [Tanacetum cinerariifolium]